MFIREGAAGNGGVHPLGKASIEYLARIRQQVRILADEAGLQTRGIRPLLAHPHEGLNHRCGRRRQAGRPPGTADGRRTDCGAPAPNLPAGDRSVTAILSAGQPGPAVSFGPGRHGRLEKCGELQFGSRTSTAAPGPGGRPRGNLLPAYRWRPACGNSSGSGRAEASVLRNGCTGRPGAPRRRPLLTWPGLPRRSAGWWTGRGGRRIRHSGRQR